MTVVETHIEERVALITLNDPDRRNVLSLDMVSGIVGAFDFLERESESAAVVITGAAPAFCAGADLGDLAGAGQASLREIYEGFLRVARSPLPTIAAVNGPAVGAGMNLALACDVRIVGTSGRFDSRFARLAIHPGGGHTWMLRRIVGPQAAMAMAVFGEVVGGHDAVRIGLAWQCVEDAELVDAAMALARRATGAPAELVQRIKDSIGDMATVDTHDEAVDRELTNQLWSMTDPAFQTELAALRQQISGQG